MSVLVDSAIRFGKELGDFGHKVLQRPQLKGKWAQPQPTELENSGDEPTSKAEANMLQMLASSEDMLQTVLNPLKKKSKIGAPGTILCVLNQTH